jgi:hypothetical protein
MATYQYWSSGGVSGSAGYLSCDNLTITDTITLGSEFATLMRAKIYLAGNGVDSYLVQSASFQQDVHRSPITVNNATTFYVPAYGRWSDYSSLVGFTIPGTVDAVMECKLKVPILIPITGDSTGTGEPGIIGAIDDGKDINKLTLNFEGVDGATTFTEDSQHLTPAVSSLVEIDTAKYRLGASSLKMPPGSSLAYTVPGILQDSFSLTAYFLYTGSLTSEYAIDFELNMYPGVAGKYESIWFEFGVSSEQRIYIRSWFSDDIDTHFMGSFSHLTTFVENTWYKVEAVVREGYWIFLVDDVQVATFGTGVRPTGYLNYLHIYTPELGMHGDPSESIFWLDSVAITNSYPLDTTSVTSTETITVTDNSLIQAGDTITITGTSA